MLLFSRFGGWFRRFLGRVLMLLEGLLILRIVLQFFDANASALVVKFLYGVTNFFIGPFQSIFPNFLWGSRLVDLVAISAVAGYLILYWLAVAVLRAIF